MTTIKQVSELSGVSQATVSRVINGSSRVSHDKKLRVEKAIQSLNYHIKSISHSASVTRSGCIGLVTSELSGFAHGSIMSKIEETLRPLGYQLLITSGAHSFESEKVAIEFLLSRRVDALILHTPFISDDDLIELSKQKTPIVLLGRSIPELQGSCIEVDDELGGKSAGRHLVELGHRRIACFTSSLSKPSERARLQGYRTALEEMNIAYDPRLVIEAGETEIAGSRAAEKLLNRGIDFSAIFCCNDLVAIGALEVLNNKQYTRTNPVSVIGYNNIALSEYITPKLSTIDYPLEKMSIEAVHLTLQKLNKQKPDVQFKHTPTLIARESTSLLQSNQSHI